MTTNILSAAQLNSSTFVCNIHTQTSQVVHVDFSDNKNYTIKNNVFTCLPHLNYGGDCLLTTDKLRLSFRTLLEPTESSDWPLYCLVYYGGSTVGKHSLTCTLFSHLPSSFLSDFLKQTCPTSYLSVKRERHSSAVAYATLHVRLTARHRMPKLMLSQRVLATTEAANSYHYHLTTAIITDIGQLWSANGVSPSVCLSKEIRLRKTRLTDSQLEANCATASHT